MIGPDLRSSAFQVLSALTVPENRMRGATWPQLLTFPQLAATGHCSHRLSTTNGHRPLQPQPSPHALPDHRAAHMPPRRHDSGPRHLNMIYK